MYRRALLTTAGSVLIAGCNSSDSGSTPTETETATPTPTPTPTPPAYDVSIEAPDRVPVEERFTVTVEVTNTGGQSGEFREPVGISFTDDILEGTEFAESDVQAGETVSISVRLGPVEEAEEGVIEIPGYDVETPIEVHADDAAPRIERVNLISDWEEFGDVLENSIDKIRAGEIARIGVRYEIWVHEGSKDSLIQTIINRDGEQVVVEQDRADRIVEYSGRSDWETAPGFRTDDWEPGTYTAEVIVRDENNGEVSDSSETTFEVV